MPVAKPAVTAACGRTSRNWHQRDRALGFGRRRHNGRAVSKGAGQPTTDIATWRHVVAIETITLGGGCFWCLEAVYEQVDGVQSVQSGYCNGHVSEPSYQQVCAGDTGHAEVVKVQFDAARISLREVLEIFFTIHDPTTLNRQGNDVGPQYRSGIYYHDEAQRTVAQSVIDEVNAELKGRVVTELKSLDNYWPAEAYHQHYFARNPSQGYCALVVGPKVAKFRKTFASRLRKA
jgi:peptide-methionine (S)-S-oxide reductase